MELPEGWRTWSESDDRVVLAYRPDVFDGADYPPPCLPTLYVTRGGRDRRPGVAPDPPADAPWTVTLFLEPEVSREPDRYDDRAAALAGATALASAFAAGEIDYRGLYQVPRDEYLRTLDELTGGSD